MNNDLNSSHNFQAENGGDKRPDRKNPYQDKPGLISKWFELLAQLGLSELSVRVGINILSMGLIVSVVWLMSTFYRPSIQPITPSTTEDAAPTEMPKLPNFINQENNLLLNGITRKTSLHTSIPSRPRIGIVKYIVQSGDTVFGIADNFGLKPSTILWGNYAVLKDSPHSLRPGQELIILPTDGTYHQWQAGEGLNSVAKYYGVDPETIINYPENNLDTETIGDYANPNIPVGTWLIIPGGTREFISWSVPVGITRDNPAVAQILGVGSCGVVSGGAVGYGSFVWPADSHFLSGNDFSPETNHRGIDISGYLGSPVYATDAGVIVYAGWNDYGYGNMIIIDHGNGWQSLYSHLSSIGVICSQSVGQGDVIGAIGSTGNSTGPHLHFELMNLSYGKVNPWNFLP